MARKKKPPHRPHRPREGDGDPPLPAADVALFHRAIETLGEVTTDARAEEDDPEAPPVSAAGDDGQPAGHDTDDEQALLERAMADLGVDAGGDDSRRRPPAVDRPEPAADPEAEPPPALPPSEDEATVFRRAMVHLRVVPDKDRKAGEPLAPVVPLRRRKAPSADSLRIDDSLDLHRQRTEIALRQLQRFLARAAAQHHKTVLVITGKGHHSPRGVSVLRREVERWLVRHGRPPVTSYVEAPRSLGGTGAFVLFLQTVS